MAQKKRKDIFQQTAQATIEFAFAFIVLVLIFYGCVRALQWLGIVLLAPSTTHYQGLYSWPGAKDNCSTCSPVDQLNNVDAKLPKLKVVYPGQVVQP
ncbi:MAG: hypothetical protein WCX16_05930 [Candidatus Omnitrophota bacterium]|jgi:hypothetical protein